MCGTVETPLGAFRKLQGKIAAERNTFAFIPLHHHGRVTLHFGFAW
jgi:hypothetical protein